MTRIASILLTCFLLAGCAGGGADALGSVARGVLPNEEHDTCTQTSGDRDLCGFVLGLSPVKALATAGAFGPNATVQYDYRKHQEHEFAEVRSRYYGRTVGERHLFEEDQNIYVGPQPYQ